MKKVVLVQQLPAADYYKVTRMMQDEKTTHVVREYLLDSRKLAIALDNKLRDLGYIRTLTNVGIVFTL